MLIEIFDCRRGQEICWGRTARNGTLGYCRATMDTGLIRVSLVAGRSF